MKKMLKILAMVLVIATVVFVAGCSSKGPETEKNATSETNVTEMQSGVNATENISDVNATNATVVENETIVNTTAADNLTADNMTGNESAENATE